MAYGTGAADSGNEWAQRPEKDLVDQEAPQPAEQPSAPPATAAPPAASPAKVDDDYVASVGRETLPDDEDFNDFANWSTEALPGLTKSILDQLPISMDKFDDEMDKWRTTIIDAEKGLNRKDVPTTTTPTETWPSLPGVSPDEQCTSIFDANDLALRGRRSVLTTRYYMPVIFPTMLIRADQKWAFGQKIEFQQEWRHEGFTLGELISSLSLLPNEELTLEVSSWQRTKTEIQQETSEEVRKRLESELKNTDEQSIANEAASSNGWTVSATGSFSFGPASASLSAGATGSSSQRAEQASKHITEQTTKASNEVSLRRAVKITQAIEAGSEERTTRRIRNPNSCHTVTFNFFQIVKLYDVQLRLVNDAPTLLLPGIFPLYYSGGASEGSDANEPKRRVTIPYWLIEGFTSPAVFLTQFFDVDRDISEEIHGWALRIRIDVGTSPVDSIRQLVEGLIVGVKYLLGIDPYTVSKEIGTFVQNYIASTSRLRQQSADTYGLEEVGERKESRGRSEQITTTGIYADSLIGRCSACEDYVKASRYVDVMRQYEDLQQVQRTGALTVQEEERRKKLVEADKLDPFEPRSEYALKVDITNDEGT